MSKQVLPDGEQAARHHRCDQGLRDELVLERLFNDLVVLELDASANLPQPHHDFPDLDNIIFSSSLVSFLPLDLARKGSSQASPPPSFHSLLT